jgi:hypothetical protein
MPINFSPYISLTPANLEPGDIYQQSIDVALTVLPEFNLRRGTLEDAIFQASAYMNALNIATINSLPSRLMEGFANLVGYSRFEGTRATVTLTVTAFDTLGGVVPKSTIFAHRYIEQDGSVTEYTYETAEEVDLAPIWSNATAYTTGQYVTYNSSTYKALQNGTNQNPGTQTAYWDLVDGADPSPSASIQVISKTIGYTPTITEGTELVCITTNNVVDIAISEDDFAAGIDGDIDSVYLSGARTHVQALSNSLSTANQIQSSILTNYRETEICKVYDLTNPSNLAIAAASADGYVTAFVYGKDRELTTPELTSIDDFVTLKSVPGLVISVQNYKFAPLTIDLAITYNSTIDVSAVEEIIKQSLVNAFGYINFPTFKKDITSNYIAAIVFQSGAGVINVSSCTMQHAGVVGYLSQGSTTFTASGTSISDAGTYTGVTQSATNGSGTGAMFTITKTGSGTAYSGFITVTITSGGAGYVAGNTITIPGASLGNGGDLTLTITGTVADNKYYSETANTNTSTLSFVKKGYLPLITAADITITATPLVI